MLAVFGLALRVTPGAEGSCARRSPVTATFYTEGFARISAWVLPTHRMPKHYGLLDREIDRLEQLLRLGKSTFVRHRRDRPLAEAIQWTYGLVVIFRF